MAPSEVAAPRFVHVTADTRRNSPPENDGRSDPTPMTGPATVTRAAADIGGTFTDVAVLTPDGQLATRKLPSTPENYADAVIAGVRSLLEELGSPPGALEELLHGCTVATNAILEGKGAPTALLTTRGFRDVLELRRVRVPNLYEPLYERPRPLVPRHLRFEVGERTGPRGEVLLPLDESGVNAAAERIRDAGIGAVAVCYLHSFANPAHERRTGEILREMLPGAFISLSVGRPPAEARSTSAPPPPSSTPTSARRSSGTSVRWCPRSSGPASEGGSW